MLFSYKNGKFTVPVNLSFFPYIYAALNKFLCDLRQHINEQHSLQAFFFTEENQNILFAGYVYWRDTIIR